MAAKMFGNATKYFLNLKSVSNNNFVMYQCLIFPSGKPLSENYFFIIPRKIRFPLSIKVLNTIFRQPIDFKVFTEFICMAII